MTAAIEIEKASVKFGRTVVLDLKKMTLSDPGLVVLTGANGAGKSTLLRLCAGLLRPDTGSVKIGGVPAHRRAARHVCGYSPDHPVLFDDLSIADNVTYAHESSGESEVSPLARDLIEGFGFEPLLDRFPGQLSRGQRQAASLLVACGRHVDVLLLDEPTLALDQDNRTMLAEALASHADEQLFVVASHEADMVSRATRRVALSDGRITGR